MASSEEPAPQAAEQHSPPRASEVEPPVAQPPQHNVAHVEADHHNHDDADSALGDAASLGGSATTSLASSVFHYREENGRTYHAYKDGKYYYPNGERENDRLDLQHHMWLLTLDGKLSLAPIGKNVNRVLDVGTGTGIWAIDFADEHPEAEVIGVDLSPIQPAFVPPNCSFEIDDLEADWTYTKKFSYIHSRVMVGSFTSETWPKFFAQAMEHLEPGGYLEIQELAPLRCDDGTFPDCDLKKWVSLLTEASFKAGRSIMMMYELRKMIDAAGFEDVHESDYMWPENPWPKDKKLREIGMWTLENVNGGLEDLSMALYTRVLGWTRQEVEAFLPGVRRGIRDRSMHTYLPTKVIYGRKPLAAET